MGQSIPLLSTEVFGNRRSSLQPPSPRRAPSALGALRNPLGFESITLPGIGASPLDSSVLREDSCFPRTQLG